MVPYSQVDAQEVPTPQPEPARLREVVVTLASPEFEGRSGAGGGKAAAYLVELTSIVGHNKSLQGGSGNTLAGRLQ